MNINALASIKDDDLLLVTDGDNGTKTVTGAQFKALLGFEEPWVSHDGGVFHIQNGSYELTLFGGALPLAGYTLDGSSLGDITKVEANQEVVVLTPEDCEAMFEGNTEATWEFGELTRTNNVTDLARFLYGCTKFNGSVTGWDTSKVTSLQRCFYQNNEFTGTGVETWDTSSVETLRETFYECSAFDGNVNDWNTANVTTMQSCFQGCTVFNRSLSSWDTSKVVTLESMFEDAPVFNGDISSWNVEKVQYLTNLFKQNDPLVPSVFNQDLTNWETDRVTHMEYCFSGCSSFNGDINRWNTSEVTYMNNMFEGCSQFNKSLSRWDTNGVTNMNDMFNGASAFNQDLSKWCVPNFYHKPEGFDTDANPSWDVSRQPPWNSCPTRTTKPWANYEGGIFHIINGDTTINFTEGPYTAWNANGTNERQITKIKPNQELVFVTDPDQAMLFANNPLCEWDFGGFTNTSKVTSMKGMFKNCINFNSGISNWNTRNVNDMSEMFDTARAFNKDIGRWDVSNVTNMEKMFTDAKAFLQAGINSWDTSRVINMKEMFYLATVFNQNISTWDTSNVTNMDRMFKGAQIFNQDQSEWLYQALIVNQKNLLNAGSWNAPKPVWGTCPRGEDTYPWENHDGGVFHVKDATETINLTGGPFTAWDPDGKGERTITSFDPDKELVFVTSPSAVNCSNVLGVGSLVSIQILVKLQAWQKCLLEQPFQGRHQQLEH